MLGLENLWIPTGKFPTSQSMAYISPVSLCINWCGVCRAGIISGVLCCVRIAKGGRAG